MCGWLLKTTFFNGSTTMGQSGAKEIQKVQGNQNGGKQDSNTHDTSKLDMVREMIVVEYAHKEKEQKWRTHQKSEANPKGDGQVIIGCQLVFAQTISDHNERKCQTDPNGEIASITRDLLA